MKTAREWFKELPDDIEKMAVENAESAPCSIIDSKIFEDLPDAIYTAFPWRHSTQGFSFWANVHEQHANK